MLPLISKYLEKAESWGSVEELIAGLLRLSLRVEAALNASSVLLS